MQPVEQDCRLKISEKTHCNYMWIMILDNSEARNGVDVQNSITNLVKVDAKGRKEGKKEGSTRV